MIISACICIPTYNNQSTICQVTLECLIETLLPIIIVDDGSEKNVESLFKESTSSIIVEGLKRNRLNFIRHSINRGKGVAIQSAITWSLQRGHTHMITIDGDGQHRPCDIKFLLDSCYKKPWDLIIGKRRFSSIHVPSSSKFGRKFSNFWAHYQTGIKIDDSQSGLRLYPLFYLQNMKFFTKKFDFEIEVLIRLIWKKVNVTEVAINCHYPPKQERVSHFNKFWDNVRISFLNTILVIISLLRARLSPHQIALASGLGIFIGTTPFFGLHAIIAGAFSFIFRLNAGILLLGTQISIPPIAPFLIFFSLIIGNNILGHEFIPSYSQISIKLAYQHFTAYLVGSIILGLSLGTLGAAIFYFISKKFQSIQKNNKQWTGKSRGGLVGNWILKQVLKYCGLKTSYFCLYFITPYFYLFAPKARSAVIEFWKIILPNIGFFNLHLQVLKHFYTFGTVLLDRAFQSFHTELTFDLIENGDDHMIKAAQQKKGQILMGAHVGGWNLASYYLKRFELLDRFHMIKYQAKGMTYDKIINDIAQQKVNQVSTNTTDMPIFQLRSLLNQGLPIGLMADRPISNNYELIPFFNKLVPFDPTPFRLAHTTNSPLSFYFAFKGPNKSYEFYCSKPKLYKYSKELSRQEQNRKWLIEYSKELETAILKRPHQWFNFYSVWSYKPGNIFEKLGPLAEKTDKQGLIKEFHIQKDRESESALDSTTNV